ncbi:hypothetical protein K5D34_04725 [Pseudomonas cichorii]|uniref:Lipoprotein n=1 Tax=Pseudomonas lijiangensis TaxID=2995658 RepID=A0ABX8HWX1_9PSED|nr:MULTISPECIES: hypothetical protein [Pseudomonas syringae group]MBX8490852.1 hypothetical protein [Pseudomonas cichorii]MBX8499211.1 hypothetical protein [Pseudomonas lijiangensis]MBX8504790.1 hypothetical protein [Pseudomonas lijiangensis]MBX8508993.1 hypothetical protein [Pseudomonas cichorii]MBX8518299.1 hypothetical protein [Pseudomonas cichorii]
MTSMMNERSEPTVELSAQPAAVRVLRNAATKHALVAVLLSFLVGCTSIPSQELSSVKGARGKDVNEAIAKLAPLMGGPPDWVEPDSKNPANTVYGWTRYKGTFSENKYMGATHDRSAGYLQITDHYQQQTWREYCSVNVTADPQDIVVDYEVENCGFMDAFFGSGELKKNCVLCKLAE